MNSLLRGGIPAVLIILLSLVSLPARASCTAGGGTITLNNISGNSALSPGDEVSKGHHEITYTCYRDSNDGSDFYTTLSFSSGMSQLLQMLQGIGLGVELTIAEHDTTSGEKMNITETSRTIGWDAISGLIKQTGQTKSIQFGPKRNYIQAFSPFTGDKDKNVVFSTTVDVKVYVVTPFDNTFRNETIPGISTAFNINTSGSSASTSASVGVSPFRLRLFTMNPGRVDISPPLVNLGRFLTSETEKKSPPFTVTAVQTSTVGNTITVPLKIKFSSPAGLTLTADKTAVLLKNKENTGNNGLQLSIVEDGSGNKVIFDKEDEMMGDITLGSKILGNLPKTYHAVLSKSGASETITVGKFEVASIVTVTYE
ncbi:hypothetical protein LW377_004694 [Salmonella enterica]|nr:hypothetical protein [Salmonella enterica]